MLPSAETLLALLLPRWQCQEQVSYRSHLIDVCPHLRVLSNADTLKQSCQVHAGPNLWSAVRLRTPDAMCNRSESAVEKQAS